ncbi:hypothetical protein [Flavivirga sp. 57AJ16]|uniref:hypothetical protein n=1 Tax=Flavivirga sp. 57AJ16 TaxID=3025307 RepID=UPI0023665A6B|nr:hypothetical protein [Flavivirga sp. 57AJ16]MDD7885173.1 hypothetical protein [Flavivirga sp. 57AJ16]
MTWKKIKHLFVANKQFDWMYSHGSNPVFMKLEGSINRVFFTCRDALSRSHIAYVDIDFNNNFEVVNISKEPVLIPGELGMFDDSGVVMGCLQNVDKQLFLYYLGWNLKVTVPWLNTIGLAIFNPLTGKFEKAGNAPVMDRSHEDPFSISYPSILFENGIYRMWYGSNLSWGKDQADMKHVFKYAESNDGIHWKRTNKIVVNLEHENEYALSKPWVIKDKDVYKMWYSYRANGRITTYRIGYAESLNGIEWRRLDSKAGINVSDTGWDSEMISYPCVFDFNNKRYMLYNGNEYGKTGFGIAVLNKD